MERGSSLLLTIGIVAAAIFLVIFAGLMSQRAGIRSSGPQSISVAPTQTSTIAVSTTTAESSSTHFNQATNMVSAVTASTWETYADRAEGFSFRYPRDCALEASTFEQGASTSTGELGSLWVGPCSPGSFTVMQVRVYEKPVEHLSKFLENAGFVTESSTTTSVNGYLVSSIEWQGFPSSGDSGDGEWAQLSDLLIIGSTTILDFDPSPFVFFNNASQTAQYIIDSIIL